MGEERRRGVMLAIVIGFVLALAFFGLPLGIIGLFILSILDQKSREAESAAQDTPTLESQAVDQHKIGYGRSDARTP
jgi:Flp pilus assembly protein protease CpaA